MIFDRSTDVKTKKTERPKSTRRDKLQQKTLSPKEFNINRDKSCDRNHEATGKRELSSTNHSQFTNLRLAPDLPRATTILGQSSKTLDQTAHAASPRTIANENENLSDNQLTPKALWRIQRRPITSPGSEGPEKPIPTHEPETPA